ncbi:MAG: chemotaxis protein CheW [Gemmatimonadaceae bacterium]|nr:chemotaxis protein CheW [Gemmatimonadaceae bacterium]
MKKPLKIAYRDLLNRTPAASPTPASAPVVEWAAGAPLPELPVEPAIPDAEPAIPDTDLAAPARAVVETVVEAADEGYLVFRVGHELFALPLDAVEEAIDLDQVQPIPEMSATMLGVVSLRGELVPLYAPSALLGVTADSQAAALIFVTARGRVALAVDDVDDVMTISPAELLRAPMDFGDGVLVGVARRDADLIGVLDPEALVAACRTDPALETA